MDRIIAKLNKALKALFMQKGQGLVEFVLILAFCAAIGLAARDAGFGEAISALLGSGEQPEYVTAAIGGPKKQVNAYTSMLAEHGNQGRRSLVELVDAGNSNYTLGADIVSNEERLAADRAALENIADFFLGMDYKTLKTDVFKNELGDVWFTKGGSDGKGVLILNYRDYGSVEKNYDSASGQYTSDAHTKIEIETGGRKFTANEVIHWMQGDYGSYRDSSSSYDSSKDFNSGTRYFFSNEMIDTTLNKTQWGGGERRNLRVRFTVSGTTSDSIVTGIEVRLQHNGDDFDDLKISKTVD